MVGVSLDIVVDSLRLPKTIQWSGKHFFTRLRWKQRRNFKTSARKSHEAAVPAVIFEVLRSENLAATQDAAVETVAASVLG